MIYLHIIIDFSISLLLTRRLCILTPHPTQYAAVLDSIASDGDKNFTTDYALALCSKGGTDLDISFCDPISHANILKLSTMYHISVYMHNVP